MREDAGPGVAMNAPAPLAVFDGRALFLVTRAVLGAVRGWPVHAPFSLLLSTHGPLPPSPEALSELAGNALAAGARWVVCTGPWADEMEEALLDAMGEQEERGEAPGWEDVLVSAVVEGSIAEATWQAWNLYSAGGPPLVAVFLETDPCLSPFKALARDLRSTFEKVLRVDDEAS